MGGDDELGEVGRGQLLVQRQVEARRAAAHEADHVLDLGPAVQGFFQALDLAQRGGEGRAFLQAHVHQQLGAVGAGEELLGNQAEAGHGHDEDDHRAAQHQVAPVHAPAHPAAEVLVEAGVVDVVLVVVGQVRLAFALGQHVIAQQRDQHHGREPGRDQRDGRDLEDRARVFAGAGLGQRDGQEAGHGDQRAGQHGEGGARRRRRPRGSGSSPVPVSPPSFPRR